MIEAVVFDCDGTLLDSMPAWHEMQSELAQEAHFELGPRELEMLNANTLPETAAFFHTECGLGESNDALLERIERMLFEKYRTTIQEREGAADLVRRLHADGVSLAIASSSPILFLRAGLTRTGIYDLFDVIASADDEGQSKSNPEFAAHVASRLDVDPARSWCVDDSLYALQAMAKAGFKTLGIYDSDNAGTRTELMEVADLYVDGFADLNYAQFVNGAT